MAILNEYIHMDNDNKDMKLSIYTRQTLQLQRGPFHLMRKTVNSK